MLFTLLTVCLAQFNDSRKGNDSDRGSNLGISSNLINGDGSKSGIPGFNFGKILNSKALPSNEVPLPPLS
ncbi:hypothetical protein RclHR1_01270016 [Rhizophagus clarus]|uniref:Uncharacterized protein n=1 Tax=Rhizophagus clarus TaxID=94130 RepID=A0A2Z6Q7X3_9GLOM|nr:hypothetical protein RclHR1_01270016 [Rhizophagus clarus]